MIDLIKFVIRGALGGAIFPFVIITGLSIYLASDLALGIFRALSYWYLIPGAVIGLTLWVIARFGKPLNLEFRFAVGASIPFALLSAILLIGLIAWDESESSLAIALFGFVWIAIASMGIGGIAGLACPNGLSRKQEPKLNYWERVALYEIAEREASVARARVQARPDFCEKSRANSDEEVDGYGSGKGMTQCELQSQVAQVSSVHT